MSDVIAEPDRPSLPPVQKFDFKVGEKLGHRARIGVVVLATDEAIEHEFRLALNAVDGVAVYQARIPNEVQITPETLRAMESRIANTARLLLPQSTMDVIAYGCTSASIAIGPDRVAQRLAEAEPSAKFTNPATAGALAMRTMGVKRLALLTPYGEAVNAFFGEFFQSQGFEMAAFGSFLEENDGVVASIDPDSLAEAAYALGSKPDVDGVFVSCTNLRLLEKAAEIEARLGKPVSSSNHAIIWHSLRLAGIEDKLPQFGRLYGF